MINLPLPVSTGEGVSSLLILFFDGPSPASPIFRLWPLTLPSSSGALQGSATSRTLVLFLGVFSGLAFLLVDRVLSPLAGDTPCSVVPVLWSTNEKNTMDQFVMQCSHKLYDSVRPRSQIAYQDEKKGSKAGIRGLSQATIWNSSHFTW